MRDTAHHHFAGDLWAGRHGLERPYFAVFPICVGLVVFAATDRGRPRALLGSGGPWILSGTSYLPRNAHAVNRVSTR